MTGGLSSLDTVFESVASGRSTSTLCVIMGAVAMKISSRTKSTSSSGTMLISDLPSRRLRRPRTRAMLSPLVTAAFARESLTVQDSREFFHEVIVILFEFIHTLVQTVVGHNRRDSGKKTDCGSNQGFCNTRGNHLQGGLFYRT